MGYVGGNTLYQQLDDAGRLTSLLPDLEIEVVDRDCYDLERDIVFKERSPEDFIV